MKKMFYIAILWVVLILSFSSCSGDNPANDLSSWVGTYVFEEIYEHNSYYEITRTRQYYEVTIYEDNGEYLANILVDHWESAPNMPVYNFLTKIYGNDEWISLVLISDNGDYLSTGTYIYSVLLSFRREGSDIYTYWGELKAWVDENQQSDRIYLKKVDDGSEFESRNIDKADLSPWVGTYIFEETWGNIHWGTQNDYYEITIYEKNIEYFADILIEKETEWNESWDGERNGTSKVKLHAKLIGDENWISLMLLEYWEDGVLGTRRQSDDIMLSFRREGSDIYTYWGRIRPYNYENQLSNKIHFVKID